MSDFSPDFLWGSATAAHQVEGNNLNNDWWAWEHDAASPTIEISGDAIDHWNRYDADFALLSALGQNAHRISLEWSRIEPAEGEFSQAALDHYGRVLASLERHRLTAFVTLYHFTLPQWFAERGGWLAPDALEIFERFVDKVAQTLGHLMPYICTINEPQIVALMAYGLGQFPPGRTDMAQMASANAALAAAHRSAVKVLRAAGLSARIGTCLQLPVIEPLDPSSEADQARARGLQSILVEAHLADLKAGGDIGDFVGLQYYTRMRIDASQERPIAPAPMGAETTLMGWEVYPAGLGAMLRRVGELGLPVVITENGIATADDAQRVRFLKAHLREVKSALDEGVDIRGYIYWSAFDNFEWTHGYEPTFGLIGIDRQDDLRRIVRPSAAIYGEIARTGSLKVFEAFGI